MAVVLALEVRVAQLVYLGQWVVEAQVLWLFAFSSASSLMRSPLSHSVDTNTSCDTKWNLKKQECIPVGCVPADRRPYAGVCFPGGGGSAPGGGLLRGGSGPGGCLLRGGVVLHAGGVSALGGCLLPGGVWSGGFSMAGGSGKENPPGWENPSPPVNRMTDRCKNITLAKTSFRPVKNNLCLTMWNLACYQ